MKKLLLVGAALLASTAVHAADMAMPVKAPAPMPVPVYDWSGVYIGGHVGAGWSNNAVSDPGLGFLGIILNVPAVQNVYGSGFIGGGQVGWNYQIGRLVIGTEFDANWADLNATSTTVFTPFGGGGGGPGPIQRALGVKTDWTATSTIRLGLARGEWLFYSKAGAAFAHNNYSDNWTPVGGGPTLFTGTGSETRVGWTVGTGLEWAFMNSWSAKVEYDYLDFGSRTVTVSPGGGFNSIGLVNAQAINEVKVGINYRLMPLP
jgi:outer membrane immunogenic protein